VKRQQRLPSINSTDVKLKMVPRSIILGFMKGAELSSDSDDVNKLPELQSRNSKFTSTAEPLALSNRASVLL
jgi:hypothetical protein